MKLWPFLLGALLLAVKLQRRRVEALAWDGAAAAIRKAMRKARARQ